MNRKLVWAVVFGLGLVTLAHGQTTKPLKLYDSFDGTLINPSKWISQWQCGSPSVMECQRDIRHGQLHLRVRGYGVPNTNQGNQYGVSAMYLSSSFVTDIATQVTVQRAASQTCPANTGGLTAKHYCSARFSMVVAHRPTMFKLTCSLVATRLTLAAQSRLVDSCITKVNSLGT